MTVPSNRSSEICVYITELYLIIWLKLQAERYVVSNVLYRHFRELDVFDYVCYLRLYDCKSLY